MNDILSNQLPQLVALITRSMTTREEKKTHWATFKRHYDAQLCEILGVDPAWGIQAGSLIGFDVDPDRKLILLNYTAAAHNILHEIDGGWTPALRQMRGLVYAYEEPGQIEGVRMVSRGFEKFFNQGELPETSIDQLRKESKDRACLCVAKEDGHMIEYFLHDRKLAATTRGRFGTPSANLALQKIRRSIFIKAAVVAKRYNKDLMTLVCEFVDPTTEVHVDYSGESSLYLLEAYDTSGYPVGIDVLRAITSELFEHFKMPSTKIMSVKQLVEEINDRSVVNHEGWVAHVPTAEGGHRRVKFKYVSYIGEMVKSKLSYKYLMKCIQNDRLDKMLFTLPEEIREKAYSMVMEIGNTTNVGIAFGSGYKELYGLFNENEGGRDYFRTVCRDFYRAMQAAGHKRINLVRRTGPNFVEIDISL